jgi:hypothetical protein
MRSVKLLPHTILALLLTGMIFIPVPQLQAGASNKNGSPYGNGTFFPNNGTFSAIERSSNGFLGVLQFSTSSTNSSVSSLTNTGIATIYAEGQQFSGSAFGTINASGQTLAATYFANTILRSVTLPTLTYNSTTVVNTNSIIIGVIYTPVYGLTNFSQSNNVSGQFTASLANSYPNQTFSGNGQTTVFIQSPTYSNNTYTDFFGNVLDVYVYNVSNNNIIYNTTVAGVRLSQ